MVKFLDLYAQYRSIKGEVDSALAEVISNSAFIGGKAVRSFEDRFACYQGAKHCVGVGNGTDALEIAIEALGLPPGSEIIVPANSFIASAEAVTRAGHQVVFADVDGETYTLDPSDVARRITPKTSAIIAVHLYGHPCDMASLLQLASRGDLKIIEDCAQAHGAEFRGQRVGVIGDIGTFSFYPGKNLGAYGDGGAIVCNDDEVAEKCRMIANHGRIGKYDHLFEGRNSRLDGIQAAILSVKLKYLDQWIDHRNLVAHAYVKGLEGSRAVLPKKVGNIRHSYHIFAIRSQKRDALTKHLEGQSIQTGIHYPISLPQLPAYKYLGQHSEEMIANSFGEQLLSLPIGEHITEEEISKVIEAVQSSGLV